MKVGDEGEIEGAEGEEPIELEEPPNAKDQPLLASPARRKDVYTTTPASKGKKYRPVKYDRRNAGARTRSYIAQGSKEKGRNTKRNTLGTGALDLFSLGSGIYEEGTGGGKKIREQIILNEEKQVLENNKDLKILRELLNQLDGFSSGVLTENKKEDINNGLNKGKKLKELNLNKSNMTFTTKKEDQSDDESNDETGPKEE